MRIWVIGIGEPLPLPKNNDRLHRCGLLNEELIKRDHNVVWWCSTFNHFSKKHIFGENTTIELSDNYKLELLHGPDYQRNISFSRIKNHWELGNQFLKTVDNYEKPDIIFCAFPSIELAYYATKYSKENDIPIVVDARDMWPDIFSFKKGLNLIPVINSNNI